VQQQVLFAGNACATQQASLPVCVCSADGTYAINSNATEENCKHMFEL
jgi:hypothetical protein